MKESNYYYDFLMRGIHYLEVGKSRTALAYFDIALDFDTCNVLAWFNKGISIEQCSPQQFGIDETEHLYWAAQCYEEAVRIKPTFVEACINLADIYLKLSNQVKAAEFLKVIVDTGKAEALEPQTPATEIYYMLAQAYKLAGQSDRALLTIRDAKTMGYDSEKLQDLQATILSGRKEIAIDVTGHPLSFRSIEIADMRDLHLISEARSLIDSIRMEFGPNVAIESQKLYEDFFEELIEDADSDSMSIPQHERINTSLDIYFEWVRYFINRSDIEEAKQMITQLEEDNRDTANVSALYGYLYYTQKQYLKALPYYEKAVEQDNTNVQLWDEYIITLAKLKQLERAWEECRRAIKTIGEKNSQLILLLAKIDANLSPSRALGTLFKLEKTYSNYEVVLIKAICLTNLGRNDEARALMNKLKSNYFKGEQLEIYQRLQKLLGLE